MLNIADILKIGTRIGTDIGTTWLNKKVIDAIGKTLEEEVGEQNAPKVKEAIEQLSRQKANVLIVGSTGAGKSSTIKALFEIDVPISNTANPETMEIKAYSSENLTIWDSPGLGDGIEQDKKHIEKIKNKLLEKDEDNNALIDMVLIIVEGGSRNLDSVYTFIQEVLVTHFVDDNENVLQDRIILAINKCDKIMEADYSYKFENGKPTEEMQEKINEWAATIKQRVRQAGLNTEPICYCAGNESARPQIRPYNLLKLQSIIITKTPTKKRLALQAQTKEKVDGKSDKKYTKPSMWDTFWTGLKEFIDVDWLKDTAKDLLKTAINTIFDRSQDSKKGSSKRK